MARRSKLLVSGAVLLLVAAAAIWLRFPRGGALRVAQPQGPPARTGLAAGTGPARVLLNEILFQPVAGQSPWVELVNVGGQAATLDGLQLQNQAGDRYALPAGLTLPSEGVLLVRFDGTAQTEGTTIHAAQTSFLARETGSLALYSGAEIVDQAFWSTSDGPSFNLGRGGHIPEFVAGTTLGRPRRSTARGPSAWTIFDPAEATPATSNPFPSVRGLMPLSGAILRTASLTLAWYGVPTAARYRVQVATDRSFASPVFDRTTPAAGIGIEIEQLTIPAMPPGRYLWRVQAIFDDGDDRAAAFSRPAVFWLEPPPRTADRSFWRDWLNRFTATVAAAQSPSPARPNPLPVPLILQRKDTSLLSLEGDETGARRWDGPWPLRITPYCARASIAMIAAFFGGNLSQDRISYEGDKGWMPGPQRDLNVLVGWLDPAIERALTFAVGIAPRHDFSRSQNSDYKKQNADLADIYWTLHQAAIDDGVPVLSTSDIHAWVVVGYGEDARGRYFTINDPASGQYDWLIFPADGVDDGDLLGPAGTNTPADAVVKHGLETSFFVPRGAHGRSDEPEVSMDSDGDGVMDFDEAKRFGTDSRVKDSDGDGVNDKQEIRAWVFDEKYGYWPGHGWIDTGSDHDHDRRRMETDADSDNGGCPDGIEDLNRNGKHEPAEKESYNFEKDDDACVTGSQQFVENSSWNTNGSIQKLDHRISIRFAFREVDGVRKGRATVTASYRQELHDPPINGVACPDSVDSTEPYQYAVDVRATGVGMPDGTEAISVSMPPEFTPPMMRMTSTCRARPPFEQPGPPVAIGGTLNGGVFHERKDLPLDREGGTGTKYYETDIRRIGPR